MKEDNTAEKIEIKKMNYPKPIVNPKKRKMLVNMAWAISAVVLLVVGTMRRIKIETSIDFSWLPGFYSVINAIVAILLIIGLVLIRKKQIGRHQKVMFLAMILSLLFLVAYVIYHITTPETTFCREGNIRYIYFALLISHVVLAAIIFPFILFTFIRAAVGDYVRHKKMAKVVFPFWLYVAITGPLLYIMLYPCYN